MSGLRARVSRLFAGGTAGARDGALEALAARATGVRAADAIVHEGACLDESGLVCTPAGQWNYALSVPLAALADRAADARLLIETEIEVVAGEIGIGCVLADQRTHLQERTVTVRDGAVHTRQVVDPSTGAAWIVVRNVASGDVASRARIGRISATLVPTGDLRTLTNVPRRRYAEEAVPPAGGLESFEDDHAQRINRARLDHLAWLDLPVQGRSVLDVGCGVGHFSRFYVERGCRVVGLDGRQENIERMRSLYPEVEGHVGDVQKDPLAVLGRFDVVHCYGLLYHLENPVGALRNIASVCDGFVVLETMVCDASRPLLVAVDESKSFNQALDGIGSRPSPSFVVMTLNRVGFDHVYIPSRMPDHPEFQVTWRDRQETRRDGHDLRCVFVASRARLDGPKLVPVLD